MHPVWRYASPDDLASVVWFFDARYALPCAARYAMAYQRLRALWPPAALAAGAPAPAGVVRAAQALLLGIAALDRRN